MSIERCNDMSVVIADELRRFLQEHRHDDGTLAEAFALMEEHDDVFDPTAFEKGERGRSMILLMRLDGLLDRHPKAGPLLHRLFEAERRARSRSIHLLRQSEKLGSN